MKTAVRYCVGCEKIVRGVKCGCGRDGFSTNLKPLTFDGYRIIRRALTIAALAGIGWLLFNVFVGEG